MKVLFLGKKNSTLISYIKKNDAVIQTTDRIERKFVIDNKIEFIISYGYAHIIKNNILSLFENKAVNLHISYLPWNQGADPNFWSFIEHSPKGVTIHYLDAGIDTGDIIVQKEINLNTNIETLKTSYVTLQFEIQKLFKQHWLSIKNESCPRKKQIGEGSFHKLKDKESISHLLLKNGWDTPVSTLESYQATL